MIIECVGLPGAGKTTVCNLVAVSHGKKGAVPLHALRPSKELLGVAWQIALLCLSARPFSFDRVRRGFNLVVFLRHYQARDITLLMDQGIVQKLWSILLGARQFSLGRVEKVLRAMKPLAPDSVVWLRVPAGIALNRLVRRAGGNSRFDKLEAATAEAALLRNAGLLEDLIARFPPATGSTLYQLDGLTAAADNARVLDSLLMPAKHPPADV